MERIQMSTNKRLEKEIMILLCSETHYTVLKKDAPMLMYAIQFHWIGGEAQWGRGYTV